MGTDVCPCCGFKGGLAWIPGTDKSGDYAGTHIPEEKLRELQAKPMPFLQQSQENADNPPDEN